MSRAPEPRFDEIIHAPVRLRICGLLRRVDQLEFGLVRQTLDVSAPTLSKHLRTLTEAGYVRLTKSPDATRADARLLTWIHLTPCGTAALDAHLAALREIVGTEH
ncbi:helix-turn-helix domain-containing protein [Actinotalea sp. K2]|uniref:winged helix-turn-helix domain-containing protein n=1 Tax=Actinotalea sp. K2 TaxID=2939438 RepID=UPI0020170A94|nr:helix-turn-helix domain-containing protein [Actinotalea sp. K2]MCL3863106.1 helix-turn-helix domain-containing protein [Actinotalea sp. K2]